MDCSFRKAIHESHEIHGTSSLAETEVLIIGCGIAGATAALRLARNPRRRITVVTRATDPHESNTRYAQGGIIGRGLDDNSELLLNDILAAGAGVSSPHAARILAEEGPPLLHEILEQDSGVVFDHDANGDILAAGHPRHEPGFPSQVLVVEIRETREDIALE